MEIVGFLEEMCKSCHTSKQGGFWALAGFFFNFLY